MASASYRSRTVFQNYKAVKEGDKTTGGLVAHPPVKHVSPVGSLAFPNGLLTENQDVARMLDFIQTQSP